MFHGEQGPSRRVDRKRCNYLIRNVFRATVGCRDALARGCSTETSDHPDALPRRRWCTLQPSVAGGPPFLSHPSRPASRFRRAMRSGLPDGADPGISRSEVCYRPRGCRRGRVCSRDLRDCREEDRRAHRPLLARPWCGQGGRRRSSPRETLSFRATPSWVTSGRRHRTPGGTSRSRNGWVQMPEGVRDRPTMGHEYLFLLSKVERYHDDHAAVREPSVSSQASGNGLRRGARLSYADSNGARGATPRGRRRSTGTDGRSGPSRPGRPGASTSRRSPGVSSSPVFWPGARWTGPCSTRPSGPAPRASSCADSGAIALGSSVTPGTWRSRGGVLPAKNTP